MRSVARYYTLDRPNNIACAAQSYFDQAAEVSSLLNIKLTSRKWDNQSVLMCGFPVIHLQRYLKTLVQQNHRFVALCEEFARPASPGTKPLYDRRVARIVTPGTLIDEPFLNHYENNYLMAISPATSSPPTEYDELGLAWLDVSTGEFFTKSTRVECLYDDIVRTRPREVVLPRTMESVDPCPIRAVVRGECIVVSYFDTPIPEHLQSLPDVPYTLFDARHPTTSILSSQEGSAVSLLTGYLQSILLEYMPSLSAPRKESDEARMEIDAHTLKSLEIREGVHGSGGIGTLLGCVRRTVTSGGTRLLSRWLCASQLYLTPRLRLTATSQVHQVHPCRKSILGSPSLLFSMPSLTFDVTSVIACEASMMLHAWYKSSFWDVGVPMMSLPSVPQSRSCPP